MLVLQCAQAALVNAGKGADIRIIRISCAIPVIFFFPCGPVFVSVGEIVVFNKSCLFLAVEPEAHLIPHFAVRNFEILNIECMAALDGGSRMVIGACFLLYFITFSAVEQCHEGLFLQDILKSADGVFGDEVLCRRYLEGFKFSFRFC